MRRERPMNRLTARYLRVIRDIIIIVGIFLAFILWLDIPSYIQNNPLVHVGNGEYGSKIGFLAIMMLPLLGLIPRKPSEEIHTSDVKERIKIENEREIYSKRVQIAYALFGTITACLCMVLGIVFG